MAWPSDMTWDVQEIVELLQGPITRAIAKRMDKEQKGKVSLFEKIIQDLTWLVLER